MVSCSVVAQFVHLGDCVLLVMESLRTSVAGLDLASKRRKIICPRGSVPIVKAGSTLLAWVLSPRLVKVESLETTFSHVWPPIVKFSVKGVAGMALDVFGSSFCPWITCI